MAVGSKEPAHVKAELYDFDMGEWTTVQDYPFGDGTRIYNYDMVYIPQISAYVVIGGFDGFHLSTIAMFKKGVWSEAGQLHMARYVSLFSFFVL